MFFYFFIFSLPACVCFVVFLSYTIYFIYMKLLYITYNKIFNFYYVCIYIYDRYDTYIFMFVYNFLRIQKFNLIVTI